MEGPGWAPLGLRQLAEYALEHPGLLANEAVSQRYYESWMDVIKLDSLKELVPAAAAHMRLLHAVDLFPRGARARAAQEGVGVTSRGQSPCRGSAAAAAAAAPPCVA
jgi:hypothetical protein